MKRIGWLGKTLLLIPIAFVLALGVVSVPFLIYFAAHPGVRAFVVPTLSMCPTICENERILVDGTAYRNSPPQRGDAIMLSPPRWGMAWPINESSEWLEMWSQRMSTGKFSSTECL
jgi:signal peptidase I